MRSIINIIILDYSLIANEVQTCNFVIDVLHHIVVE